MVDHWQKRGESEPPEETWGILEDPQERNKTATATSTLSSTTNHNCLDSPSAHHFRYLPHTITNTYTQSRQRAFAMASILLSTTSIVRAARLVGINFGLVLSSACHDGHNASAIPTCEPGLFTARRLACGCFFYGFCV